MTGKRHTDKFNVGDLVTYMGGTYEVISNIVDRYGEISIYNITTDTLMHARLEEIKVKPKFRPEFRNVYPTGSGAAYPTLEEADANVSRTNRRIGVLEVRADGGVTMHPVSIIL